MSIDSKISGGEQKPVNEPLNQRYVDSKQLRDSSSREELNKLSTNTNSNELNDSRGTFTLFFNTYSLSLDRSKESMEKQDDEQGNDNSDDSDLEESKSRTSKFQAIYSA